MHPLGNNARLRAETWTGPKGPRILLLAGDESREMALLLALDPVTRLWMQGTGRFRGGAIEADRDGFEDVLRMEEATCGNVSGLGLSADAPRRLTMGLLRPMLTGRPFGNRVRPQWMTEIQAAGYVQGETFDGFHNATDAMAPPAGPDAPRNVVPLRTVSTVDDAQVFAANAAARKLTEDWVGEACPLLLPREVAFLRKHTWNTRQTAHYTEPGDLGARRRQAGTLYPFLAPVLYGEPTLRSLVDEGRPYEKAACEALDRLGITEPGRPLDVARLRRLRGVATHRDSDDQDLLYLFDFAARLSPGELDRMRDGDRLRLYVPEIADIMRWRGEYDADLPRLTRALPVAANGVADTLGGAADLVRRFTKTVVTPVVGRKEASYRHALAGSVLFRGCSLRQIEEVSDRWHRRLGSFEAALPAPTVRVTWPALFEPVEVDGFRIGCLTDAAELAHEGAKGVDPEGYAGLDHCVGGFSETCHDGESHIASVRHLRDGRWERLSTVEIKVEDGVPRVVQHKARDNAVPPETARIAVGALVDMLVEGRHPLNPEALKPREPGSYHDGIAWNDPAVQEQAWTAWKPYLPRAVRAMGFERFAAWLRAENEERRRLVNEATR